MRGKHPDHRPVSPPPRRHESHRCLGVAYFAGVPVPWLVKHCRSCACVWPCPDIVRIHAAVAYRPAWMYLPR